MQFGRWEPMCVIGAKTVGVVAAELKDTSAAAFCYYKDAVLFNKVN